MANVGQTFPFKKPQAFMGGPYNPWTKEGDPDDSAYYIAKPGENFARPWLRIPGGRAFVWPLGVEGFSHTIDPKLGIHSYIGDNAVKVDVMHMGEERIHLSGTFPGATSIDAFQALRALVRAPTPKMGKILYVPHLFDTVTSLVVVASAHFDRGQDDRGTDLTYDIEFVYIGVGPEQSDPLIVDSQEQPQGGKADTKGSAARTFTVNGTYNSLRKIAALKLKSPDKWRTIYNKNKALFLKLGVPMGKVPTYRLKIGTKVKY